MTHVIYVTHNMLSKLISLIDYVGESTSMIINELNEKADDLKAPEQKKNLSETTLSQMNTHTQSFKNELMELINEQIPFVTERRELFRKIISSKRNLLDSSQSTGHASEANFWIDTNGKLRNNNSNCIE